MGESTEQRPDWQPDLPVDGGSLGYTQGVEYQHLHQTQPVRLHPDTRTSRLQVWHLPVPLLHGVYAQIARLFRLSDGSGGMSVSHAALILTFATFAARFMGLMRTSLFASVFGSNAYTDAYNLAFNLPDFIYNIIAGGALLSAFIPVFNIYMVGRRDERTAWHITSAALNITTVLLIFLALVGMIFARPIVQLYYFGESAQQLDLVASLMRVMFLQSVVMGVGVIISSVLNARQHFLLPAIGSVLYPIGLIIGLLPGLLLKEWHPQALAQNDYTGIYWASWGVVLGAILMVVVQIPGLRRVGMRYHPTWDWRHPGIWQIARQMVPRMINAGMITFSQYVDFTLIGFLVLYVHSAGLVTQYRYALTIVTIPLGVITPLATAAFPRMASYVAEERFEDLSLIIREALQSVLFIALPACVALIILALPIIQVLFEHGAFTLSDAQSTMLPLMCYTVGLPGLALVEILTRPFYALRLSKLPVYVSVAQFLLKIVLGLSLLYPAVWCVQAGLGRLTPTSLPSLLLAGSWGMGALALSTSVAGTLEAVVLLWLLHRRLAGLQLRVLLAFTLRVLLAAGAMAVTIFVVYTVVDDLLLPDLMAGARSLSLVRAALIALKVCLACLAGALVYLRTARLLRLLEREELRPVNRLLTRLRLAWI